MAPCVKNICHRWGGLDDLIFFEDNIAAFLKFCKDLFGSNLRVIVPTVVGLKSPTRRGSKILADWQVPQEKKHSGGAIMHLFRNVIRFLICISESIGR